MAKLRMSQTSRRGFLRRSPLFLASLALAACRRSLGQAGDRAAVTATQAVVESTKSASASSTQLALTPACGDSAVASAVTPPQTPGPFYRPSSPQRQSLLEADTQGTKLTLTGQVLSPDCQPLANCLVDFWQTDDQGNYDNTGDRLRGHQFTDNEGRYRLETIVPGLYPGRTRHLHVLVQPRSSAGSGAVLTTQLYLPNEPLNPRDFLFQPELLMAVQDSPAGKQAQFNFVVEAPDNAQAKEETKAGTGDIWAQLRQPQSAYVLLMRHTLAPGTGDPANFRLGDCSTQRNLSAEGRDQARRTGEALRQRGVAVQRVLSSEWCRCVETAKLMDVGPVEPFAPINSFFRDRSSEPAQTAAVRQFMNNNSQQPGVTLMVTHFVNIAALAGSGVASGELVVMRLGPEEHLARVGAIAPF